MNCQTERKAGHTSRSEVGSVITSAKPTTSFDAVEVFWYDHFFGLECDTTTPLHTIHFLSWGMEGWVECSESQPWEIILKKEAKLSGIAYPGYFIFLRESESEMEA